MFRETVENLLANGLKERKDLFLIDLTISNDNSIKVVIDGDNGVTVDAQGNPVQGNPMQQPG